MLNIIPKVDRLLRICEQLRNMKKDNVDIEKVFEIDAEDRVRVRNALRLSGVTAAQWARTNGFRLGPVYAVLMGRSRALHGEGYRVARALGLIPELPTSEALSSTESSTNSGKEVERTKTPL